MEPSNAQQNRWETIDAYLRGELDPAETHAFEARLADDPALQHELESVRTAGTVVRHYARREELRAIHEKMIRTGGRARHNPSLQGARFYVRVAATIVLLLVAWAGIGLAILTPDTLYADDYTAYLPETTREADSPRHPAAERLIQTEYSNARYNRVVELYANSRTRRVKETFLAGNAYLALNRPTDAALCFKRVMYLSARQNNYDYYQDAEYYLAWAYLKDNRLAEAMPLFEKIYRSEFHTHNPDVTGWFFWKLKLLQWKRAA